MASLPAIEFKSLNEIKSFQEAKLKELLTYLNEKSPYYKRLFQQNKIDLSQISTLEDLRKIPVTTKNDLNTHNKDFICVEKKQIIDYVTTSGTEGEPVMIALTETDLQRLSYNEKISLQCAGTNEHDVFQLMTTLDRRFMAGLAYFLGIRALGAGVIRVGNGIPALQWDSILRFQPTVAIAVPSFILKLIEYAEQNMIDYKKSSIKKFICIGESIRNVNFSLNTLGTRIKEKWDVELYSTYASTEMGAAFTECSEGKGGHHHPELVIIEILDENNNPVKPGQSGELTVTTLGVEGMPLLRFKTGDVCTAHTETCACRRNTVRLSPVLGRKQHLIKYKGTTVYPASINDVLNKIEYIQNYFVEVYTNEIGTDEIRITVSVKNPPDNYDKELKSMMQGKIRVVPEIITDSQENILNVLHPELSRKAITFFDRRRKNL